VSWQKVLAFVGFVGVAVVYGLWAELEDAKTWVLAVSLTVSILHFWYDGFIWSVRKKQVAVVESG